MTFRAQTAATELPATEIVKIGETQPPSRGGLKTRLAEPPRILVVDDADTIRFCVTQALTDEGFDVVEADRAHKALTALKAQTIDLMLLDLGLPDMDGLDVLRSVNDNLPDLDVIVFTVRNDRRTKKTAEQLGAADYITKPFDIDEVVETIARQFE